MKGSVEIKDTKIMSEKADIKQLINSQGFRENPIMFVKNHIQPSQYGISDIIFVLQKICENRNIDIYREEFFDFIEYLASDKKIIEKLQLFQIYRELSDLVLLRIERLINKFSDGDYNLDNLQSLLTLRSITPTYYSTILGLYFDKLLKVKDIQYKDLQRILSFGEKDAFFLFNRWLWIDENNLKMTDIINLLDSCQYDVSKLLKRWLEKNYEVITLSQMQDLCKRYNIKNEVGIYTNWLEKDNNNFDFDILKYLIKASDDCGYGIAMAWLKKNNLNYFELEELVLLCRLYFLEDLNKFSYDANDIVYDSEEYYASRSNSMLCARLLVTWLAKDFNNFNEKQLKEILQYCPWDELSIIEKWFNKNGAKLDFEDLKEVLSFIRVGEQIKIIEVWTKATNKSLDISQIYELIDKEILVSNKYNIVEIVNLVGEFSKFYDFKVNDLLEFMHLLYPNNEAMQVDLFVCYIKKIKLHGNISSEVLNAIKEFVCSIIDNDLALKAVDSILEPLNLTEFDFLQIISNRISDNYVSIKEILDISIVDSIKESEIENIKSLFHTNSEEKLAALQGDIPNIKLSSILAYYDIHDNLEEFLNIIKPDILEKIRRNFKLPSSKPYILPRDVSRLKILLPELKLPKMADLCHYLRKKVPPIPKIDFETYKINWKGSKLAADRLLETKHKEEKSQDNSFLSASLEDLNLLFRKLLIAKEPDKKKVKDFFEILFNVKIKESNINKLQAFFIGNKLRLAYFFSIEGNIDKFAGIIAQLSAGCVANIATHAYTAVIYMLIKDDVLASNLFGFFDINISRKILGSGGDHLGGGKKGTNILNSPFIMSCAISPLGIVSGLIAEFYKVNEHGKIIVARSPLDIIIAEFKGKDWQEEDQKLKDSKCIEYDRRGKVLEQSTSFGNFMTIILERKQYAEIATYLIVKNLLPFLLKEPSISEFIKRNEEILSKVKEINAQEIAEKNLKISKPANNHLSKYHDRCCAVSQDACVIL